MEAWKQLVNTTLLGTEKAPGDTDFLQSLPQLTAMRQALNERDSDAETRMLDTTAVLYLYRRCGVKPLSENTKAETAAPETKPYCNPAATEVLKDILGAGSMGLLQLWLSRCAAKGHIVSPELIDVLLQTAAQHKALRPLIVSCCGRRGEWLCNLNPEWNFHTEGTDEERWEIGTTAERAAILSAIRKAEPGKARVLLETVWTQEQADAREELLQVMKAGLSEEDLPFLESIAADKSKRVQAIAYDLLTRLPGSRIVQAFQEALGQSVKLQTTKKLLGMMSKTSLEIAFPKELDKQLPDAIGKKPAADTVSEEEFRLLRMMGNVPPSFWETHFGLPPQRILELFEEAAKDGLYRDALRDATIRYGAKQWAALFKAESELRPGLLPLLSPEERKEYLSRSAKTAPGDVIAYYAEEGIEWPDGLASLLLSFIATNPYQYNKGFFNAHAQLIPLNIAPKLASLNPPTDVQANDYMRQYAAQMWQNTREHLTLLLELKQRTTNAFQN